jgi:cytochrome c biogenesis factor
MEVGIEDCLHIEFEYSKSKWDTVFLDLLFMVLIFYFSQNFIDDTGFSESTLACYNCTTLVCYIAHAVTSLMQFHHVSLVTSNCAHQNWSDNLFTLGLAVSFAQIPFEGCDSGKDLLLASADQNKAHGARSKTTRVNRIWTKHLQWERDSG